MTDEDYVGSCCDIRTIGSDRGPLRKALEHAYREAKAGAIPVRAVVLLRFAYEMKKGDVVIARYRADRTLNFGVITGDYEFLHDAPVHPHCRSVRWIKTGVSRGLFPQKALCEIGSALTLFKVKKNVQVFERFLEFGDENIGQEEPEGIEPETVDEWIETEPSAARLDQFTRDFIENSAARSLPRRI